MKKYFKRYKGDAFALLVVLLTNITTYVLCSCITSNETICEVEVNEVKEQVELNKALLGIIKDYYTYKDEDHNFWLDVIMETDNYYIADSILNHNWDYVFKQ